MGCIFSLLYLLLVKNSARESVNTVPQGYGMYFRLCLSPIEKLRRGECKIEFHTTGMWNVFQAVFSLMKAP